nr:MAG TPA: hypothetical protein [Caudoviricetes sp.]
MRNNLALQNRAILHQRSDASVTRRTGDSQKAQRDE